MVVVKKLAAKFEVKLIAKFSNAFFDVFRLNLEVFLAVDPYFVVVFIVLEIKIRVAKIQFFDTP